MTVPRIPTTIHIKDWTGMPGIIIIYNIEWWDDQFQYSVVKRFINLKVQLIFDTGAKLLLWVVIIFYYLPLEFTVFTVPYEQWRVLAAHRQPMTVRGIFFKSCEHWDAYCCFHYLPLTSNITVPYEQWRVLAAHRQPMTVRGEYFQIVVSISEHLWALGYIIVCHSLLVISHFSWQ
jgi:hypothetical protein